MDFKKRNDLEAFLRDLLRIANITLEIGIMMKEEVEIKQKKKKKEYCDVCAFISVHFCSLFFPIIR
jgi:hypothetical protein